MFKRVVSVSVLTFLIGFCLAAIFVACSGQATDATTMDPIVDQPAPGEVIPMQGEETPGDPPVGGMAMNDTGGTGGAGGDPDAGTGGTAEEEHTGGTGGDTGNGGYTGSAGDNGSTGGVGGDGTNPNPNQGGVGGSTETGGTSGTGGGEDPGAGGVGGGSDPGSGGSGSGCTEPPVEEEHGTALCHVPPGNPPNAHTIRVGAPAVAAHLHHGDYLGECR